VASMHAKSVPTLTIGCSQCGRLSPLWTILLRNGDRLVTINDG
jgi:hypothetical protein